MNGGRPFQSNLSCNGSDWIPRIPIKHVKNSERRLETDVYLDKPDMKMFLMKRKGLGNIVWKVGAKLLFPFESIIVEVGKNKVSSPHITCSICH